MEGYPTRTSYHRDLSRASRSSLPRARQASGWDSAGLVQGQRETEVDKHQDERADPRRGLRRNPPDCECSRQAPKTAGQQGFISYVAHSRAVELAAGVGPRGFGLWSQRRSSWRRHGGRHLAAYPECTPRICRSRTLVRTIVEERTRRESWPPRLSQRLHTEQVVDERDEAIKGLRSWTS